MSQEMKMVPISKIIWKRHPREAFRVYLIILSGMS